MNQNEILPYHIRKIDENVQLTEEIWSKEINAGCSFMYKECERLNKFIHNYYYRFSYNFFTKKDKKLIEFYLIIETPNEEGSWL